MPNKRGREVGDVRPFRPQGLLPDGLLLIARPTGEAAEALVAAGEKTATAFNRIADEAAVIEGDRAGRTAGLDPNFRPTGSATLRGRAFDDAAVRTYQDNLDASLRTDMQNVFEANKSNPGALKKAFDALGDEYRGRHVFDEIRGSFNASFARLRLPYENKALSNLDSDAKDRRKATLIDNITASQTNAARIAAADPNDPQSGAVIAQEMARIDRLYDEAARNDVITAAQAATLKTANRNSIVTRAALAQADALKTPDEVRAYRANTRKAFGAGKIGNLTAEGFDDLDAKLEQIERSKRTQGAQAETLLQKNVSDFVQRAIDGFAVSPDEFTRYAASDGAKTPRGQQILELGQKQLLLASVLRNRSVADGEALVSQMRQNLARNGATSEGEADLVRFAEKLVKDQRTALNTDQLGLAERKQLVPAVAPVNFQAFAASNDPAAAAGLAAEIRNRTAQARAVAAEFQRQPQFLRPEEKARLKEIVDQGGDKALALAGAIVKGADVDAPAVLREIGGEAPLLAQAGVILSNGGSVQAARDALETARIKAAGGNLVSAAPTVSGRIAREEIGAAFAMQPDDASRIRKTADAIATARITRGSVDPKGSDAEAIYRRAVQEAAGAVFVDGVQYGGVAAYRTGFFSSVQLPVPPGVRADALRDVVRSIRDDDLAKLAVPPQAASGRPYSARELHGATPVAVRGGYRFALGDPMSNDPKYVRGADGAPFVLPDDAFDGLRNRVPRAFLGAR